MGYREIPTDRILKFKATPGFKGWKRFFTEESVAHPAKMNLNLLRWILKTYTKPGEIVLDPMAGTGSTIVLARLMGRHGVAVEYEPRFCEMIRENIGLTERQATLTPKGSLTCIQGDARELSKLRGESDTIVTSPPYGEAQSGGGIAVKGYDGPKHSPTDLVGKRSYTPDKFEKENNIGVLKYGDVDTVVTSPPYEDKRAFQDIGFMKSIVHEQNIKAKKGETKAHYRTDEAELRYLNKIEGIEYEEPDNIGTLKSKTYLDAMLKVYRECWKVLKSGGKMVLVVKNFIRDKAVVRLDMDTIKLCEAAGFTLSDRWYFKLTTRSFWKILYRKKYPNVPEVEYEDVLVFKKEAEE
ncbi:hypothetical protein ES702_00557 [subsurface metagenome]